MDVEGTSAEWPAFLTTVCREMCLVDVVELERYSVCKSLERLKLTGKQE